MYIAMHPANTTAYKHLHKITCRQTSHNIHNNFKLSYTTVRWWLYRTCFHLKVGKFYVISWKSGNLALCNISFFMIPITCVSRSRIGEVWHWTMQHRVFQPCLLSLIPFLIHDDVLSVNLGMPKIFSGEPSSSNRSAGLQEAKCWEQIQPFSITFSIKSALDTCIAAK